MVEKKQEQLSVADDLTQMIHVSNETEIYIISLPKINLLKK